MIIILSWLRPCPTDKTCHYINRSLSLPRSAVLLLTFVGSVRGSFNFLCLWDRAKEKSSRRKMKVNKRAGETRGPDKTGRPETFLITCDVNQPLLLETGVGNILVSRLGIFLRNGTF
jgi:hypothetical protein